MAHIQSTTTIIKLMGGKLRLERRNQNPMIYARSYVQGKDLVFRTGETGLVAATKVAEEWWHDVRSRVLNRENIHAPTFAGIAEAFLESASRDHSASQVMNFRDKWTVLKPYFGGAKASDIDKKFLFDLRGKRSNSKNRLGDPLAPSTLKKDMLFIRLVLRYARDEAKCIRELPDIPTFTKNTKWEIQPLGRPIFSKREYFRLLKTAVRRMREPGLNPRTQRQREELTYFIVVVTGAALRVGEAYSVRWRDCHKDANHLLTFSVLGKHSKGRREEARGTRAAYGAFLRIVRLNTPIAETTANNRRREEKLFRHNHRNGFRELLIAAGLRTTSDGRLRNLKSLRPTGISFQLDAPQKPNYIDIAKWTRTSVAMIEKYYDQRNTTEAMDRVLVRPPKAKQRPVIFSAPYPKWP